MTPKFRLGWITDPHINFVAANTFANLCHSIANQNLDALVVTGDISEGHDISRVMTMLQEAIDTPIFFVLGNHDYYKSSIEDVRTQMVEKFSLKANRFAPFAKNKATWLPAVGDSDFIQLAPGVALCGHDGWYDGGYANWFKSLVVMCDYQLIAEFALSPQPSQGLFEKLQALAKESADYVKTVLPKAFKTNDQVYLATHVPVFAENAVYNGKISDDNWMPHFSNRHMGDAILEVMAQYPDKQLTVLQGHSHGKARFHPTSNIKSITGFAQYRRPALNDIFEF